MSVKEKDNTINPQSEINTPIRNRRDYLTRKTSVRKCIFEYNCA